MQIFTKMYSALSVSFMSLFSALMLLATALMIPAPAHAAAGDLTAAAQTGINGARDDALTVGGYVIAASVALLAVFWILNMAKRK